MTIGTDHVQSLVKTRRLLLLANQVEKKHLEPNAETPSFKEIIDGSETRPSSAPEVKPATNQARLKYDPPKDGSTIDTLT
jgi:hypothetical protein